MISSNLKISLAIVIVLYFIAVMFAFRNNKIPVKSSLLWFLFGLILILFLAFPHLLENISQFIGIKTVSNLLFLSAITILFVLCFDIYKIVNIQKKENIILVQEIGILKHEINRKKQKIN